MVGSDVWTRVADGLVRGLHHELNNRVAALAGLDQVIGAGGEMTGAAREAMGMELARMRQAVALLGRVPPPGERPHQALRIGDALETAAALATMHPALRDLPVAIEGAEALSPVRADRSALERALLVMLVRAAGSGTRPVRAVCAESSGRVSIGISSPGGSAHDEEAERHAIAAWLRPSDGILETDGADTLVVSFPALSAR